MDSVQRFFSDITSFQRPPKYEAIHDETVESLGSASHSRGCRIWFPFPRRKRTIMILLLVDFVIIITLVLSLKPLISLLLHNHNLFQPRFNFHHSIAAPDEPGKPKVPRILHQTAANSTIPEKWIVSQHSCKEVYSDYEYKLWTDEDGRNLIAREFPAFLDSFNNYAFPIQRADAIRYFILYYYGGIYMDMDTLCNQTIPMQQVENDASEHIAVFKSTEPTGITNDFMISSKGHPALGMAVSSLPAFYSLTRSWAESLPYVNIMLSSGPLFLSLVIKDYLLQQPYLPSPAIKVIKPPNLNGYITDLESSTWHRRDAQIFMWLGTRPWIWFVLGGVGVFIGLNLMNSLLLFSYWAFNQRLGSVLRWFQAK